MTDSGPLWLRSLRYRFLRLRIALQGRLPHPRIAQGERFKVIRPLAASGLVQWKAPFTSGFECVIPPGTILVANHDSVPVSIAFGCVPANSKELEAQLVPEQDRTSEKYGGYYFVLPYKHIGRELEKC